MKLFVVKAQPATVLGLLKCIDQNEGNTDNMKMCVNLHLQKCSGKTKKRNLRSDFYGITLPLFRKLKLISGHGRFLRLNSNGKLILRKFYDGGFEEFKHHFGRLILEVDKANCRVVSSLIELSSRGLVTVGYPALVEILAQKGISTSDKDERLRKWLPFLTYFELVKEENTVFQVNSSLINRFVAERDLVPFNVFEKVIFEEYEILEAKEGIYVPIHELMEAACVRLIEKGFPFLTFDFSRYLSNLLKKHSSMVEKKILLSQPGKREEEGIYVDDTYYYFISIYNVKKEKDYAK
ncbi:MAG: hypothetical protein NWF05_10990 [Candidatus Bathyarchaeota archaeon]|nr:hypothetical protein [Candidatus Bathyarchaeota archaeon]